MPRRGVNLSEEQWRNVKSLAAKRGQTISEWFGDVIMEQGIGRAKEPDGSLREYPGPMTDVPVAPSGPDPILADRGIRSINPAPKPERKKR